MGTPTPIPPLSCFCPSDAGSRFIPKARVHLRLLFSFDSTKSRRMTIKMLKNPWFIATFSQASLRRPEKGERRHAETQPRKCLTILNNSNFQARLTLRASKPHFRLPSCRKKPSARYCWRKTGEFKGGKRRGDGAGYLVTWRNRLAATAPKARLGAMTASSAGMLPAWPKEAQNPKNSQ
jgi:hypothetical protein